MDIEIKNEQVEKIYNAWEIIWKDSEAPIHKRLKAYSIMNVIEALVFIYEEEEEIDEEEIADLFINWGQRDYGKPVITEADVERDKEGNPIRSVLPVFPEDRAELIERLRENEKNYDKEK